MTLRTPTPRFDLELLTPRDRAHNQERLRRINYRIRQRSVWRLMRQVLLAGEEPHERPALSRNLIADRPAQRWIARLECIQDRALRYWSLDFELHFALDLRQCPQMCG